MTDNPFRRLPSVTQVLQTAAAQALLDGHPRDRVVAAVRAELEALRESIAGRAAEGDSSPEAVADRSAVRLAVEARPHFRRVINATGIVLHTNLGRAPLAEAAARAAADAGRGYLNLELDLASGKRSSRQGALRPLLAHLTGAESATVVNNCAAATVLVLRALAAGREVVVSRGQLIEIGGSFRLPEIMAVSGAVLREVGTTNITRLGDYERAIGPHTGLLLLVHTSNYRVRGFTEAVPLADLVGLGRKHGLPVIHDAGSGAFIDFARFGLEGEPVGRASIAAGADLVIFSGDKLLGGPQAGLILGRADLVERVERDPLMRAVRLDKMTLAALEATLRLYRDEEQALREVPALRLLGLTPADLRPRAEALASSLAALPGVTADVRDVTTYVGGGSLPDQTLPSVAVALTAAGRGEEELAARLRTGDPAVLGRVQDGRVLLDLRTVFPEQDGDLASAIGRAFQEVSEEP
jgi:L-seryl-tRNA(Ser) seleniumtransferase